MSDSVYTNTNRSPSLATGGHDTGLYDPDRHDNRIVAVYETSARAAAARDMLVKAGVPAGDIEMLDQSQMAGTTPAGDATDQGLWGSLKSLFVPDEDAHGYAEGVRRGHAVLSVDPSAVADRHQVIEVLESTDPIDFDARLEQWRQAGYTYPNSSAVGAAEGMITPAPAHVTDTTSTTTTTTGTAMGTATAAGMGAATGAVAGAVPAARTGAVAAATTDDPATLRLVEERLRVGKREVARGAVRIRSYVVERPVEEQVSLHDERVTLERRAVDRPAGSLPTDAFTERTIEVRATGEEVVVAKEARVVEEIGIRKEVSDRTETVRDTVRRTEVEVEDTTGTTNTTGISRTTDTTTATPEPTVPGSSSTSPTGGQTTTSTTGATSSGMNAPRK